jgi:methylenetetrahydrofolate dehydrogenase (NADP+)/methenyltetrahydrofolate cyclohydrolase
MDGRTVANQIKSRIKEEVKIANNSQVYPNLVTILVGDDPASRTYLKNKHIACGEVGIKSKNIELAAQTSQIELEGQINDLNSDPAVTGILLQIPLPKGLSDASAIAKISKDKDVDGLNPCNLGLLTQKDAKIAPCTPKGVIVLLKNYRVQLAGRHAVVINRTKLVGRPLGQLLLNEDATVTTCHSKSQNLASITKQADILVTGIGRRSEFTIGPEMVKPGATVIDIGTSSVGGKLMGDVDFEEALKVASLVTPVPGGVGPMTISMLLYNTLLTACMQKGVVMTLNPYELSSPVSA